MKSKPDQQEITEFCVSVGLQPSDGEWLFHKWEGNGWRNNGEAIKNWKGTVQAWRLGSFFPSQKHDRYLGKSPSKTESSGLIRGWGTQQERRA